MQFKEVKEVQAVEEKSTQEIENELLKKHEEEFNDEQPQVEEAKVEDNNTSPELSEEDVLTYIGNRYGKEISSIDEFVSERQASEELPEDVAAYFRYKKETGRGMDDYIKLNKDYNEVGEDELIMDYYRHTEEGLDDEDLGDLIDSKFGYDEDLDEESVIKKQKLAKKRELVQAKKFFKEQQEQYKAPLESSTGSVSTETTEELGRYRQKAEEAKGTEEINQRRVDEFLSETNKLFTNEFKGFEFNVNDKAMTFKPAEASELKKSQESILTFVNKYTDDNHFVDDAEGYHRALSVAMNPDKFAKFFYEQGKSDAVDDVSRKSKNIDMDMRRAPETTTKGGFQVKSLSQDSGRGLKIKSATRI
jgi:hypothetical protein